MNHTSRNGDLEDPERPQRHARSSEPTDPRRRAAALLAPRKRHPYYIVSPPYVRTSAGVRVLHLLCNALNRLGENAYLVIHPFTPDPARAVHAYLDTPLLDAHRMRQHFEDGLCPITVYPETLAGNPFDAPLVVRYLLNFPGLLGGDENHPPDEVLWAYSEAIAERVPACRGVLFVPVSDSEVFTPEPRRERKGSCFYASKYRIVHGGEPFEITRDSIEITRDLPDSPTPQQIAELFRGSEVFYCYENSALAIEALLCECPVVFLPNPYLDQMIGLRELGTDGIAWGTDPEELARARATVRRARDNYLGLYDELEQRLRDFIAWTQDMAGARSYLQVMRIPSIRAPGFAVRVAANLRMLRESLRERGTAETMHRMARYWKRAGWQLK